MYPDFSTFAAAFLQDLSGEVSTTERDNDELNEVIKEMTELISQPLSVAGFTVGLLAYSEPFMSAAAQAYRNFYVALVASGFTEEAALQITTQTNFLNPSK